MVGVVLPARNRGISGTLPTILAAGATYRQGVGAGSYNLVIQLGQLGKPVETTVYTMYIHCTYIVHIWFIH